MPVSDCTACFYDHVPGFDGLRVPARYAMIAAVFLSITCRHRRGRRCIDGARGRADDRRRSRWPRFLVEAAFAPMPVNQTWGDGGVDPAGTRRTGGDCARGLSAARRDARRAGGRRVSVRRSRMGAALRLLLDRALEAPRQRLQRRVSRRATRCASRVCSASPTTRTRRGRRSSTLARRTSSCTRRAFAGGRGENDRSVAARHGARRWRFEATCSVRCQRSRSLDRKSRPLAVGSGRCSRGPLRLGAYTPVDAR